MATKTTEPAKPSESRPRRAHGKDFGESLLSAGLLTPAQLDDARKIQRKTGDELERILVRLNHITEDQIAQFHAKSSNLPYLQLMEMDIPRQAI